MEDAFCSATCSWSGNGPCFDNPDGSLPGAKERHRIACDYISLNTFTSEAQFQHEPDGLKNGSSII